MAGMRAHGLKLGVNIDHVATLRQARGTDYPDIMEAARLCEKAGAHGITVHLREDRRHIQDADVYRLKKGLNIRLNLEMATHPEIVAVALDVRPDEVCLVPEKRAELTTEGGLDVCAHREEVRRVVRSLKSAGILVSLFVDADKRQLAASAEVGASTVEIHTGAFCNAAGLEARRELKRLITGAEYGHRLGLKINAGHGLNLNNVERVLKMPHLDTLNIGHSIVARAIFVGMERAVKEMLARIARGEGAQA
jgi:pyridoxine 5-phosphate synthase